MNKLSIKTGGLKFALGWLVVFLIRLIPFRPANFEPMLSAVMPYSKKYGLLPAFSFGFLGIVVFDAVSMRIGLWTFITATLYGLLGVGAYYYFKNRKAGVGNFVAYGIIGTLAYDFLSMLIGPIFYNQPLMMAVTGQIPFTIMHLAGSVAFAIVLSPLLYRFIVTNDSLELSFGKPLASQE
jgi:hypothetical protein